MQLRLLLHTHQHVYLAVLHIGTTAAGCLVASGFWCRVAAWAVVCGCRASNKCLPGLVTAHIPARASRSCRCFVVTHQRKRCMAAWQAQHSAATSCQMYHLQNLFIGRVGLIVVCWLYILERATLHVHVRALCAVYGSRYGCKSWFARRAGGSSCMHIHCIKLAMSRLLHSIKG
ncbi:hypothetical protein COO60DRAFT_1547375 [Scenedesmus sp. NREL 46B-D3]|nr:hypothetical protein COO60DRAFT_1547375 [Scenedesmus sp. NREL 46B-D3]